MRTQREVGILVSGSFGNSSAVLALVTIPDPAIWSYLVGGAVLAIGLVTIFLRGDWQKARGFDKLLLFGSGGRAAGNILRRRRPGAGGQPYRAVARARHAHPGCDCAILRCNSGAVFSAFEQFLHGNYVPGIPLNRVTPEWVYGDAIWTYLAAAIYAVAGMLQENPPGCIMAGLDRALPGIGGLRADRSGGPR
jgi:hypothetical protein